MTAQPSLNLGSHGQSFVPSLFSRWLTPAFIALSMTLASFAGADGLSNIYSRWRYEDEYGYGFLALAVVILLFWRRWHLISSLSSGRRWPGLVLIIAAQLCNLIGVLGESYFIEQVAFVFTMFGLMLVAFGTGPVRIFVPLTLVLLLTIPWPYTLQAIATVNLQLLSTNIGVAAIRLIGIPVFVDGNIIDLGRYKLQVAEACSGLRYLLPLTCISLIVAYLYQAPLWKRAIVVASAPPITILINSVRITIVAVLVDNFGSNMAEGFLHEFEGWVIFLIGTLMLFTEILVLEGFRLARIKVELIFDRAMATVDAKKSNSLDANAIATVLVCAVAFGGAVLIARIFESTPISHRENFATFPSYIGGWVGREEQLEPEITNTLKATDYYIGGFSDSVGRQPVNLFVAYYDLLSKGAAIHSPRVCLPAGGWEFASFEERNFGELSPGTAGTFNRVVIQKGEQQILMYYWFQQRERRTSGEFSMKYYLLLDALNKGRKDGALVRLYVPIIPGENAASNADARLRGFAKAVIPAMRDYLPQ